MQCSAVQRVGVTRCHLVVYFEQDSPGRGCEENNM